MPRTITTALIHTSTTAPIHISNSGSSGSAPPLQVPLLGTAAQASGSPLPAPAPAMAPVPAIQPTAHSGLASHPIYMHPGNTVHVKGMHLPNCPSFDGNMSAQEWFQKFNVIHDMHGYSDHLKLRTVQLYFTSQPLQWYNNLSESDKSSWANFTQAFRSRYLDCNRFNIFSKIGSTKQLPNECVMDFVTKLQTLARPLNFSEDQLLPSLIDNVLPHLKPEILRSKPNTLKEFIEAAKLAENIHQVTNNPSAEYTAQIHHLNARLSDLQSALTSQMQELSLKQTESVNALRLQNAHEGQQQSNNFKNNSNKQNPNKHQKQHYQPPQHFNPRPMLTNNHISHNSITPHNSITSHLINHHNTIHSSNNNNSGSIMNNAKNVEGTVMIELFASQVI
jgi:hypothetical protein